MTDNTKNQKTSKRSFVLRGLFIVALLCALISLLDMGLLWQSFQKIGLVTVISCFTAEMLFCAIESQRICFLSAYRFDFTAIWRARLLTGFMGNFLPGVVSADAMRIILINRGRKDGLLYTALLIIANRVYGLLALFCLLLLSLVTRHSELPQAVQDIRWPLTLFCAAMTLLPLGLRIRLVRYFLGTLLRKLPRFIRKPLRSVYLSGINFVNLKNWFFALTSSMVTGCLAIFQFWMISRTIGVAISFQLWIFLIPFITIATLLPLGFGAIGTQDMTLIGIGALLGMPPEPLLAVSVGMHLMRLIGTLPGIIFIKDGLNLAKAAFAGRPTS